MGGSSSQSFPRTNWQYLNRGENYDIYQSDSGLLAEKHVVPYNPKYQEEQQLQAYYYRYTSKKPIVGVYDAQFQDDNHGFCSNQKNMNVMTQYIPFRLCDTKNLTHGQGLYVLSEALAGFQELHHKVGAFPINDTLIGFNQDGRVKVWHSPDFGINHFDRDNIVLMSIENPHNFDQRYIDRQEEEMVEDVWNAVEAHALMDGNFRQQVNGFREYGFYGARKCVHDAIEARTCYVPDHLKFEDVGGVISQSRASRVGAGSKVSGYAHNAYNNNNYDSRLFASNRRISNNYQANNQPATNNQQTVNYQQQPVVNYQPQPQLQPQTTVNYQQPAVNYQQPTVNYQTATIGYQNRP